MGKKGAKSKDSKSSKLAVKDSKVSKKPAKKERPKKDPNQPKRPATAFFIFLEEFRKTYKRDNPDVKGVAAVGKAGGDKWKSMTEKEKEPYVSKAAARRQQYTKDLEDYNKKKEEEEEDAAEAAKEAVDESEEMEDEDEDSD